MSNLFKKTRTPTLPKESEPLEQIERVTEDASDVQRREKKKLLKGGRRGTILSGIASVLKKRLGE
jgi:hypothetical protein